MKTENKEPELLPENELLKSKGTPFIWLGLLLIPILFAMIGVLRKDHATPQKDQPAIEQKSQLITPAIQAPVVNGNKVDRKERRAPVRRY